MSAPNTLVHQPKFTSSPVEAAPVVPADFKLATIVYDAERTLTALLPPGHTIDRVLVELWNVCQKTPALQNARAQELIPALCNALSLGGVIGRDVYLAPFNNSKGQRVDVTVMVDYKFEAELVCMAGGARSIQAHNVYANEERDGKFSYSLGSEPFVKHTKLSPSARGAWIGSYAVADLGTMARPVVLFMFAEEIEAIRAKSKSWGPRDHAVCPDWYGPKTCVHRIVKLLPKKPALRAQLDKIAQAEVLEFGGEEVTHVDPPAAAPSEGSSKPAEDITPEPESFDGPPGLGAEANAKAGQPEPEPEPARPKMSIVEAGAKVVNSKALGTYSDDQLAEIGQWASDKCDEEGEDSKFAGLLEAVHVVIDARKDGRAFDPTKAKKSARSNRESPF
jgi:recombinational DNA repair protein RecT